MPAKTIAESETERCTLDITKRKRPRRVSRGLLLFRHFGAMSAIPSRPLQVLLAEPLLRYRRDGDGARDAAKMLAARKLPAVALLLVQEPVPLTSAG